MLCAFTSLFCAGVLLVFVKIAFVLPMCMVVVGKRRLLVVTLLFVAYTFLLGGAILGLFSLLDVSYQLQGNLSYYTDVPIGVYIAGTFAVLLLSQWLARYIAVRKKVLSKVVQVQVNLCGQTIKLDALCDSGNLLTHNNLPVCFAVGSFAKDFSQTVARQILVGNVQTICYSTVAGSAKSLAIKCQVTVEQMRKDCYIALSNVSHDADYQLILNGDFLL